MNTHKDVLADAIDDAPAALTALEAIITERRTVKQFADRPVPRTTIARLIEAAVWAPNHRLNEPWRFYVLDGDSRTELGTIAHTITERKLIGSGAEPQLAQRKAAEAAQQWASVPALLFITMLRDSNPEIDLENYGAVCCAIQNLSLAAQALGLGTSWSSGAIAAAPELLTLVGAGANEQMVGLIRVGYPDPHAPLPTSRRTPGATFTTWLDEA